MFIPTQFLRLKTITFKKKEETVNEKNHDGKIHYHNGIKSNFYHLNYRPWHTMHDKSTKHEHKTSRINLAKENFQSHSMLY